MVGVITLILSFHRTLKHGDHQYVWNAPPSKVLTIGFKSKTPLSTTDAHSDFVKSLLVIPSLSLLVSGSSDKVVRFWSVFIILLRQQYSNNTSRDISGDIEQPLVQLGSLAAHTRPVEALAFISEGDDSHKLYTTDSMGLVKVWQLERTYGDNAACRATFEADLESHRTGVTDIWVGSGLVWSGK